jgi:hypothetical protein
MLDSAIGIQKAREANGIPRLFVFAIATLLPLPNFSSSASRYLEIGLRIIQERITTKPSEARRKRQSTARIIISDVRHGGCSRLELKFMDRLSGGGGGFLPAVMAG